MENSKGEQKGPEEPSCGYYEETETDLFNVPSRPVNEKSFSSDLALSGQQALYQTAQGENGGSGKPPGMFRV